MTLAATEVIAAQHLWIPEAATGSYGAEVADLADLYGQPLDDEQRLDVDALTAHDKNGHWVAIEAADIEPRQNGKTDRNITSITLADLFLWGADEIFWTAHLFPTARKSFEKCCEIIEGCHYLGRRIKNISYAHGEEEIELKSGATLRFLARSSGGGRGMGGKRVVMDEALILPSAVMAALLPTLSARPNAQVLYASSAGKVKSTHLRSLRRRGRAKNDPALVWVERCAPERECLVNECDHRFGTEGCALDNRDDWVTANHAMRHGRMRPRSIEAERRSLPPDDFANERLGHWQDPPSDDQEFDVDKWETLGDADVAPQNPLVLGLDVAPEQSSATIIAVGAAENDPEIPVLEIPTGCRRKGTKWVVKRLLELREAHGEPDVVLDPGAPAGAMIPALMKAGIEPVLLTSREVMQACQGIISRTAEDQLLHRGQPELTAAAIGARRRAIGDGFKWVRVDSSVDISPWCAATWATFHWQSVDNDGFNIW